MLSTEPGAGQRDDPQLLKRQLYSSLYLDPPGGFQKALALTDKLMSDPRTANDPSVQLWKAAAEGQRFRWLSENNGKQEEKADARSKALDAIKRTIGLDQDPGSLSRSLLRQMFDPQQEKSPEDDNDLEVFKDDPEFRAVIYPS
jgi:hypothetical protein